MMNSKIKNFWNDHKVEIISGVVGAALGAGFVGYAKTTRTDISALNKMVEQFSKVTNYNEADLVYTVLNRKQTFANIPSDIRDAMTAGMHKGPVDFVGPLVHGPALLIKKAGESDELVGVFAL